MGRSIITGTSKQVATELNAFLEAGADRFVEDFNFHGWETEDCAKEQVTRYKERVAPPVTV